MGATWPATRCYPSGGSNGAPFEQHLVMQHPADTTTRAAITACRADGPASATTDLLPAGARFTVDVSELVLSPRCSVLGERERLVAIERLACVGGGRL